MTDLHTPETRRQIAACDGVYTARDTARHFGIGRATVYRIWADDTIEPAAEPPNIWHTRITGELIRADLWVLVVRGYTLTEAAEHLGTTVDRLRGALLRKGAGG